MNPNTQSFQSRMCIKNLDQVRGSGVASPRSFSMRDKMNAASLCPRSGFPNLVGWEALSGKSTIKNQAPIAKTWVIMPSMMKILSSVSS